MELDWRQRRRSRQEPSQELSPGRERTQWGAEEREAGFAGSCGGKQYDRRLGVW